MEVQSLFHFTVEVTDFEQSLAFYDARIPSAGATTVMSSGPGWSPATSACRWHAGAWRCSGIGDGPDRTRLGLIQWLEPEPSPPPPGPGELPRSRVIALRTRNVAAAYVDLSARGIEFVSQPQSAEQAGIVNVHLPRPRRVSPSSSSGTPTGVGSRIDHLERRDADG
ncbi:MAG: hypothetical protein R2695_08680 [Acidimicrobiales bacterium]